MQTKRVTFLVLGPIVVAAVLLCLRADGETAEPETPGKMTYTQYCSACHGRDAKGNGPVASWLTAKPTDLTQMAKNAGGTFPMMQIIQSIDGSTAVRAHGDTDMPVWGETFRAEVGTSLTRQAQVRGKILLIADYLRSIQVK
jgi:mono/diheme cytochrome c family protein